MSRILARIGAALVALGGIWALITRNGNLKRQRDEATGTIDTIKRAQDADTSTGDDDANLDWLRERGKR